MTDPRSSHQFPILASQPQDDEGPIFNEPWQAQAFAMTLKLFEQGLFSWKEWAEQLHIEIAEAQKRGEPDLGDTYYHHWLAALEKIVAKKGALTQAELTQRKKAWEDAIQQTEHGQPIQLKSRKETPYKEP